MEGLYSMSPSRSKSRGGVTLNFPKASFTPANNIWNKSDSFWNFISVFVG